MTPDEDDGYYWTRLARFFSGEMSATERKELEDWIAADPNRREEVVASRALWDQAGRLPSPNRIDGMWADLVSRLRAPKPAVTPFKVVSAPPYARDRRWTRTAILGTAAMVVVLLGGGLLATARSTLSGSDEGTVASYTTVRGETRTLRLADGSTVHLGPDSKLSVHEFVRSGPRRLELVGEAVFRVEHDADRPFYVSAGMAITEDLGTEFGIRAYPGDEAVRVVVTEGQVALRSRDAPDHSGTVLNPGQRGSLDTSGRIAVETGVEVSDQLAWVEGRIIFRGTPLREAAAELGRRYDARIETEDSSVQDVKIYVNMPAGSLPQVLEAIVGPAKLRYERQGEVYRLVR